ncbi:hypothetical protein Slin14017_G043450 [Septoria linicola]|nr:hypothetical protein Slin14017_G043450 [Septoria linicola]
MRLINTTTLELEEFFDANIPKYAILSHRWGPDEVTYEDYLAGKNQSGAGYQKILDLCRLAGNSTDTSIFGGTFWAFFCSGPQTLGYPIPVGMD